MTVKPRFPVYVRAVAIILLIAMVHYMAGYRVMYSLGILYAKEDAKVCMKVNADGNRKFVFSTAEYNLLKWNEKGKEFSCCGQMYDVKNLQKSGDTYTITAYSDNIETEITTAFNNFENELFHPDQSSKGAKSAEDIMSSFQKDCTSTNEFKITIFAFKGLSQPYFVCLEHSLQISDNIWHPPHIS